jgi:hypothetical protein
MVCAGVGVLGVSVAEYPVVAELVHDVRRHC